jgi:Rha family phage regulatory protein
MYLMTRDGFTFLAMGFTGARAAEFKERYIAEFNRMEANTFGKAHKHVMNDIRN